MAHHRPPRSSKRFYCAIAAAIILGIAPLLLLWACAIPLGETGVLVYRYSPFFSARALSAAMLLPVFVVLLIVLHLLTSSLPSSRQKAGATLYFVVIAIFAIWGWWAPPYPMGQHWFNFTSPSHDGAFLSEAEQIQSLPTYLRHFDKRLQMSKDDMRGTRILSNTPGATILAKWSIDLLGFPQPRSVAPTGDQLSSGEFFRIEHNYNALVFASVCQMIWALSFVAAYALGRLFLSPAGAFVFSLFAIFTPASLTFSPGKDPAQLLTVCLMLWAWFSAIKSNSIPRAALAGGLLVVSMIFGLVHAWIALAAFLASIWQAWADGKISRMFLRQTLPAALGAIAPVAVIFLLWRWNVLATFVAVGRRYSQVQKTLAFDLTHWRMIGIPLFLLFVGTGLWMLWGLHAMRLSRRHRASHAAPARPTGFGLRLTLSTIAVMLVCFLLGVPYELPRLWIVFIPLLVLGACVDQPLFRGSSAHSKVVTALSILVILHLVTTVLAWSALDVRESEYRLSSQRLFW